MDIAALYLSSSSEIYDKVLQDHGWQKAVFNRLTTDSIFWNTATITCLPKAVTFSSPAALLYLLQKEAQSLAL